MISAGEFVQASGTWVNDRTHGVQFKASFLQAAPPTMIEGDQEISRLRHDPRFHRSRAPRRSVEPFSRYLRARFGAQPCGDCRTAVSTTSTVAHQFFFGDKKQHEDAPRFFMLSTAPAKVVAFLLTATASGVSTAAEPRLHPAPACSRRPCRVAAAADRQAIRQVVDIDAGRWTARRRSPAQNLIKLNVSAALQKRGQHMGLLRPAASLGGDLRREADDRHIKFY